MSHSIEIGALPTERDARLLLDLFNRADRILLKKLSNNDRDWARYENKHQQGVYIPFEHRDGGFFPPLERMERSDPEAAEIRQVFVTTLWPQVPEAATDNKSRLVHYTSKGQETHLTRVPKSAFSELAPASFLIIGRCIRSDGPVYECLTITSTSDEAALLNDLFNFEPKFIIEEFDPISIRESERTQTFDFIEKVIAAWMAGDIATFARDFATIPSTVELATMARQRYLSQNNYLALDPFTIPAPGDALRDISRGIEWEIFKDMQRRERAVELIRAVLGDQPMEINASQAITRMIDALPAIDAMMLSASQQRKSRAGYSYEHHIEALLTAGAIPFEKQVVITARKRPDFILPSLRFMNNETTETKKSLILSAKTTLRERWKQVEREKGDRNLYLTTVDETVAGNAIEDMASIGVALVIPESLKRSKSAEYEGHANVMSFREFCDEVLEPNLQSWS